MEGTRTTTELFEPGKLVSVVLDRETPNNGDSAEMTGPGAGRTVSRARRSIRRARMEARARWDRLRRPPLVLAYHRIAELTADPQLLAVSPVNFSAHLEVLTRFSRPVTLAQLTSAIDDRWPTRNDVVVTFDDGYADNLVHARPLLQRYGVPATVFITTGYLGAMRGFWWDELERLVLEPHGLPQTLRLRVGVHDLEWDLSSEAVYDADRLIGSRDWNVLASTEPDARQSLYRRLSALLTRLEADERLAVLDALRNWSSNPAASQAQAADRPLASDEVIALAEGGLIEVGAHTHTHPALTALTAKRKRVEIERSRARLEEILDRRVTSFAYPYGSLDAETVALVSKAGFVRACTTRPAVVRRNSDPLQLPRFVVHDCDGDVFAHRLGRLFSTS